MAGLIVSSDTQSLPKYLCSVLYLLLVHAFQNNQGAASLMVKHSLRGYSDTLTLLMSFALVGRNVEMVFLKYFRDLLRQITLSEN